jgi:hypothetical protein
MKTLMPRTVGEGWSHVMVESLNRFHSRSRSRPPKRQRRGSGSRNLPLDTSKHWGPILDPLFAPLSLHPCLLRFGWYFGYSETVTTIGLYLVYGAHLSPSGGQQSSASEKSCCKKPEVMPWTRILTTAFPSRDHIELAKIKAHEDNKREVYRNLSSCIWLCF